MLDIRWLIRRLRRVLSYLLVSEKSRLLARRWLSLLGWLFSCGRRGPPKSLDSDIDASTRGHLSDCSTAIVIATSRVPSTAHNTARYSPLSASLENPFVPLQEDPEDVHPLVPTRAEATEQTEAASHVALEMSSEAVEAQLTPRPGEPGLEIPRPITAEGRRNVTRLLEEARQAGLRPVYPPWVVSRTGPWGWTVPDRNIGRPIVPRGPFRYKEEVDSEIGLISPPGWIQKVTPKGRPYFVNPELRFMTDMYIRRPDIYRVLLPWLERLFTLIETLHSVPPSAFVWPEHWEMYIYVDGDDRCSYYFVSHDDRQVFWVENFRNMLPRNSRWWPASRIELWLRTQFWCHTAEFPHAPQANSDIELRNMLINARLDVVTFPGSTSPFSAEECTGFLQDLQRISAYDADPAIKTAFIARLNRTLYHSRLHYHWSEEGARCDRREPAAPAQPEEHRVWDMNIRDRLSDTLVMFDRILVAVITFGATEMQMSVLREANGIDNIIIPQSHAWRSYLAKSVRQAEEGNVISALIFVGNIAFLSIYGLNTLMTTLIAISALWALFSFLAGTLLIRQRDAKSDEAILHYSVLGLLGHAFLFSLPFAFLLWSILTFSIALAVYVGLNVLGGGGLLVMSLVFVLGLLSTVCLSFARPDWLLALLGFQRRGFWRTILSAPLSGPI